MFERWWIKLILFILDFSKDRFIFCFTVFSLFWRHCWSNKFGSMDILTLLMFLKGVILTAELRYSQAEQDSD